MNSLVAAQEADWTGVLSEMTMSRLVPTFGPNERDTVERAATIRKPS